MIKREDLFKTLDKKPKILLPEKNAKNGTLNFKKEKRIVQNFRSKECIEVIDIDDVKYESGDKCKTEIKDDIKAGLYFTPFCSSFVAGRGGCVGKKI